MVDAELYPEVVAGGGLAAALTEAARRDSIDLAPVAAGDSHVTVESDRGCAGVTIGLAERAFIINVVREQNVTATGTTGELRDVVHVLDRWLRGATLRDLHERFPFMTYTRLAQGYEDGDPVGAQWEVVLADPDLTRIRPLLLAARAHERLGRLFPVVTHLTMARFLLDHAHRGGPQVRAWLTPDGGFKVDASWHEAPREAATVDEAVDAAATLLDG